MLDIKYSKAAAKAIAKTEAKARRRIRSAIEKIPSGDIKPLQGSNLYYRLRVGDWRIVFFYPDSGKVMVAKIATRGDIYKGGLL